MDTSNIEDANRKRLFDIIRLIPAGIPDGWQKTTYAVGGLMYVGFSNMHTEKLVVISAQGQSIIDCNTGGKTYCDENYDEDDLIALADELGDEIVPIAGDGGGGLRRYSKDGNMLASAAPFWPMEKIIFMPNYRHYTQNPDKCTILFDDYELKAFGFSKCGNYMAVCNSHTLDVFRKLTKNHFSENSEKY
ncbi:MAG: hypothetical protein HFG99_06245 [Dorea sp.]|jgi:hypothetical protein|nr:hypothetical protein [Dorea sp.]